MADISKIQIETGIYNIKDETARNELLHKPFYFNTVAEMKAYNFTAGDIAITLGYYSSNDNGGALYKIRNIANNEIVDNMFILSLNNSNTLIAELIIENSINIKSIGAYGDGSHDDTQFIQSAINYCYNKISSNLANNAHKLINTILIPEGIYKTTSTIDLPIIIHVNIIGNPKLLIDHNGSGIYINSRNLSHISNIQDFQTYISGNIINSNGGSLTIEKKDSFYRGETSLTGSIGLEIGDRTFTNTDIAAIARCNFNNINISQFETGLALNYSNLYIVTFNNFVIQENYYNVYTSYHESTGNAGEKITFKDCLLGVARYGLYIRWGLSGSLTFENCSFDYMGCMIKSMYTVTGNINIIGGHIEGIGYENPTNNMRTIFPGVAKDWGYICYYDTSNPAYKLVLNISDTTLYLVDVGTSDSGKRFGSALSYPDLASFNQTSSTQQNLIVNLNDVNFEGNITAFNENKYNTNEIFLCESGVNINYKHTNSVRGFGQYFGFYYNDFVGRFVTTDDITRYYKHKSNIHSTLSFTKYNSSTMGSHDSVPYFANALSVQTSEAVSNMGISRITNPTSKHLRVCFIYKLNNISINNIKEKVQIYLYGANNSGTELGNTQLITTTEYILKQPNNGWHIVIGEINLNDSYSELLITPRVYLESLTDGTNQNFTATLDIGGLLVDYCE